MSNNSYSFSTNKGNSDFGVNEFLESNSLVAKFTFLLLVFIVFILLFRLGVSLVTWLTAPTQSPK